MSKIMPVTTKAKREAKKKVLNKTLKRQEKKAKTVANRVAKTKKELWQLELDDINESGLLSQLTWEFEPRVGLFNCEGTGFISKENTSNSEAVKKIQEWTWKHLSDGRHANHVELSFRVVNGYHILMGLQMGWATDDIYNGPMVVEVFAMDTYETGTGVETEKLVISKFAEKWNIEVDIK